MSTKTVIRASPSNILEALKQQHPDVYKVFVVANKDDRHIVPDTYVKNIAKNPNNELGITITKETKDKTTKTREVLDQQGNKLTNPFGDNKLPLTKSDFKAMTTKTGKRHNDNAYKFKEAHKDLTDEQLYELYCKEHSQQLATELQQRREQWTRIQTEKVKHMPGYHYNDKTGNICQNPKPKKDKNTPTPTPTTDENDDGYQSASSST